jgi:hypothetical protein
MDYSYRNASDKGMKKLLEELNIEELTADCAGRKIKMMKTVYSQEVSKIMKSNKSGAGTYDLYKPQLVWFDILTLFLWNSLSSEANSLISIVILHRCTELIPFPNPVPSANRFFSSPFSNNVDITLNRKATATRTPACITSADAILFYTGIQ